MAQKHIHTHKNTIFVDKHQTSIKQWRVVYYAYTLFVQIWCKCTFKDVQNYTEADTSHKTICRISFDGFLFRDSQYECLSYRWFLWVKDLEGWNVSTLTSVQKRYATKQPSINSLYQHCGPFHTFKSLQKESDTGNTSTRSEQACLHLVTLRAFLLIR